MKCFGAGHMHHCTVYEDNGLLIGLIVKQSEILLAVFFKLSLIFHCDEISQSRLAFLRFVPYFLNACF